MHRRSLAFALAALPAAALAHHGWSGYDQTRPVTLAGTVRAVGYEHPHGHVDLDADGRTWRVVLAPPSRMERRGLARDALVPGIDVTVTGYVHRDAPDELRAERITIGARTTELR